MSRSTVRPRAAAVLVILLGALLLPSTAQAAGRRPLTPFANSRIVEQRSLGGIELGGAPARAGQHFPRGACGSSGCGYFPRGGTYTVYVNVFRDDAHRRPYVGRITMVARREKTPLRRLHTSTGIGIGSTTAELRAAYPDIQGTAPYLFLDTDGRRTAFSFKGDRIYSIALSIS